MSGGHTWRPLVIRDGDPEVARLLADPQLQSRDLVPGMREELVDLVPALSTSLLEESACWVVYPWRRVALRILGPRSFRRLRLDRNRNKLTDVEQGRFADKTIAVVGLSVGHASAHLLALEGLCGRLKLADFDTLELSNLNRIPATLLDVGMNKAIVVARRIAELDPYLPVDVQPVGVTADNVDSFLADVDLIVEECDSLDIKVLVRETARRLRLPVVMETSDSGLLDVERFDLEPEREPFHGLLAGLRADALVGLSTDDKAQYVMRLLEPDKVSARFAASLVEIGERTTSWPQLASDVGLGAAVVAAAIRRWGLGRALPSGRCRVEADPYFDELRPPCIPDVPKSPVLVERPPLPDVLQDALLAAAVLAPSGGNVQPWRFLLDNHRFEVEANYERSSGMDIEKRGTCVALGAAMLNARVVAAAHGRLGPLDFVDDRARPERMLALRLAEGCDAELAALRPRIPQRVTNRHLVPETRVTACELRLLAAEVEAERCSFRFVPKDRLQSVIGWWREADRSRFLCTKLHGELMHELRRPGHDDLSWGIDERTLELSAKGLAKLPVLRRADVMQELKGWDGGKRLGDDVRDRLEGSGGMVVVVVPGGTRDDYLRGGAAVQRMWLRAEALGLGLQPLSPVFMYAHTEAELAEQVGLEWAPTLFGMREAFRTHAGLGPSEQIALTLRVVRGPRPTAISERESVQGFLSAGAC